MVSERSRAILEEFPGSLVTSTTEPIGRALRDFAGLVTAAEELVSAQLPALRFTTRRGARGQEPLKGISKTAGELLFAAGVVNSVDEGIAVFHREVGKDKPALRRIFNKVDRKAGRLPPLSGQAQLVSKGLVRRSPKGPLLKLSRSDRRRIGASKGISDRTKDIALGKPLGTTKRTRYLAKRRRR